MIATSTCALIITLEYYKMNTFGPLGTDTNPNFVPNTMHIMHKLILIGTHLYFGVRGHESIAQALGSSIYG